MSVVERRILRTEDEALAELLAMGEVAAHVLALGMTVRVVTDAGHFEVVFAATHQTDPDRGVGLVHFAVAHDSPPEVLRRWVGAALARLLVIVTSITEDGAPQNEKDPPQ